MVEKESGSRGRKLLEKAGRGIYVNFRRRRKKWAHINQTSRHTQEKNKIPVEQCTKKGRFFSPHKCVTSLHNPFWIHVWYIYIHLHLPYKSIKCR